MADEKRNGPDARPDGHLEEERPIEERSIEEGQPRAPYRKPGVKSGDRLEKTTLASCLTGPQFCGPFALEA